MNTDNTFSRGRFVPALASTIAQAKPRLVNKYGDYDSDMYEIPGWGFIIPVESAVNDYEQLYLDFATRGLPAGTMLGMRWTPASGNGVHRITRRLDGNEIANLQIPVDQAWLPEATGQHVLVEYEIVLPDGKTIMGESVSIWVSRQLAFSSMTVEGLEEGEPLDPARFPDGIRVNYGPIDNIEEYHDVVLAWRVWGFAPPIDWVIHNAYFAIPGKAGESYSFLIPPQDYTGFENAPYERIRFSGAAEVKLIPWPNEGFFKQYALHKSPLHPPTKHE